MHLVFPFSKTRHIMYWWNLKGTYSWFTRIIQPKFVLKTSFWRVWVLIFQCNYLTEFSGGLGRETDGVSESESHSPSALTPTITTTPVTLTQPSLPDPTPQLTDTNSPKDSLENALGNVTGKDPRKDSGIRSRRSSIQNQVRCCFQHRFMEFKISQCISFVGSKDFFFHCIHSVVWSGIQEETLFLSYSEWSTKFCT